MLQRGALGRPAQVLDEGGQWTAPLPVASDAEAEVYLPDVSTTAWLQRNYTSFFERGQFRISVFTFFRSQRACRQSLVAWGYADEAHLDACLDIGYRLTQLLVDVGQKTVTLEAATMLDQDGNTVPNAGPPQQLTRTWTQLSPLPLKTVQKATELVTAQEQGYDQRLSHGH